MGQKLREGEISAKFGVSNSVVQEAFHLLQGEGLVVTDPHRGKFVFNIAEQDAKNLALLRASLESLAAYLAARRITEEYRRRISTVAVRMTTFEPSSYMEWISLEIEFHSTIWEASGDASLVRQLSQTVAMSLSLNTVHFFKPTYQMGLENRRAR